MVVIKKIAGEKELLIRDENIDIRLSNITEVFRLDETSSLIILSQDSEIMVSLDSDELAVRYMKAIKKAFGL